MVTKHQEKQRATSKALNKVKGFLAATYGMATSIMATVSIANASLTTDNSVTINTGNVDGDAMMGSVVGILLTITRFAGVGLVVFGVYEIVMSFMQNQPEAKTKGIIMALCGIVMIALKSVLSGIGLIT